MSGLMNESEDHRAIRETVAGIGLAEAKAARWQRVALWVIAIAVAVATLDFLF